MYTNQYRDVFTTFGLGFHVARAAATLPQTDTDNLFTVSGGRIFVSFLVGEITTVIAATDPVAKITITPTTGSAVDIASTVDIKDGEAGGFIVIEGDTSAMVLSTAGQCIVPATRWVVPIGTIDLTTGASKTGAIKWDLWYFPLDEGAVAVAS